MSLYDPADRDEADEFHKGWWSGYEVGYEDGSADVWQALHDEADEVAEE